MNDAATTPVPAREPDRVTVALEALLLSADEPLSLERLVGLIEPDEAVDRATVQKALCALADRYRDSAASLVETAGGWRLQVGVRHADLVARLWAERPPRLSRALLETLAIIVYRQPLARSDIEAIRGVSVSTPIIRSLLEHEWIKVVGHRDMPGRPALYATTPRFLDDFGVARLADLPRLPEIKDPEALEAALARLGAGTTPAAAEAEAEDKSKGRERDDDQAPVHPDNDDPASYP